MTLHFSHLSFFPIHNFTQSDNEARKNYVDKKLTELKYVTGNTTNVSELFNDIIIINYYCCVLEIR